jgi:hypothetical protein
MTSRDARATVGDDVIPVEDARVDELLSNLTDGPEGAGLGEALSARYVARARYVPRARIDRVKLSPITISIAGVEHNIRAIGDVGHVGESFWGPRSSLERCERARDDATLERPRVRLQAAVQ